MNILFVLIPLGLVLVAFGLWAFFWAVGSGQFDDLDSPGWSVLADSEAKPPGEAPASPEGGAVDGQAEVQMDQPPREQDKDPS